MSLDSPFRTTRLIDSRLHYSTLSQMRQPTMVSSILQFAGGRILISFFLLLSASMVQGVGLLMVLPFLGLVGVGTPIQEDQLPLIASKILAGIESFGASWTIETALLGFVVAILLVSLLRLAQAVYSSKTIKLVAIEYQNRFHRHWLSIPWAESRKYSGGEILNLVKRDVSLLTHFLNSSIRLTSVLVLIATYLLVAIQVSVPATIMAVIAGLVLFILVRPFRLRLRQLSEKLRNTSENHFNTLAEHFNALKLIKAFARESRETSFLAKISEQFQDESYRAGVIRSTSQFAQSVGGGVILALLIYITLTRTTADTPQLLLLIFLFSRILPQINLAHETWQQIVTTLPSLKALSENKILTPPASLEETSQRISLLEPIQIKDVTFQWPEKTQPILESFSSNIPLNQITAITGSSGSGKSTLIQLILGILRPDSGNILINGKELKDEALKSWSNSIGYLPQDDFLFSQSIRENLLWGNPDANETQLEEALNQASLTKVVESLPRGLDAIISDTDTNLSGGERQRLALARALIRAPELLVLDEPTSGLDGETKEELFAVLAQQKSKCTIIYTTHSKDWAELADHQITF